MRAYDLLVVGEINPDLVLRGDDVVPRFGQAEKMVDAADLTIGSSSAIMACAAARLGLRTAFVGVVGDDAFGRFMLDAMTERGIDMRSCIVDDALATGVSVILSQGDDRAILTHLGAISALRADQVDRALLREARHMHVGGYFLLDALRPGLAELFREARREGLGTSLDTNWDPRDRWNDELASVLAQTDVLFPNAEEARRIAGRSSLDEAIDALGDVVPTVAVKLGAAGGRAGRDGRQASAPSLAIELVDTTGAGDTFDAGFLYGHLNGWTLDDALRLACACGSLSTRAAGGTEAQPTLEEARAAMANLDA